MTSSSARRNDLYSGDVIRKYEGDMPLWAYLEVVSFGCFIPIVKYCADRWDDGELARDHYRLKYVKSVCNACAHQHAIINDLSDPAPGWGTRAPYALAGELAAMGIPKRTRARRLSNARMQQIATLMSVYSKVVPDGRSCDRAEALLSALFRRVEEFLRRLTEGYGLG